MLKLEAKILFFVLLAFVFSSCSKSTKTEEEYLQSAKTLYDSAVSKKDEGMFKEAVKTYKDFLTAYPKSEKGIYAYNQIAGIYFEGLKSPQDAVNTYRELADKYPTTKEAKQSLFMIAFIYDETLKDKENAKIAYKKFLEKYPQDTDPNDKMSESAKMMLQVLESGSSIEDMILKNIEKDGDKTKKEEGKVDTKVEKLKKDEPKSIQDVKKDRKDNQDGTQDAPVKK